MTGNRRHYGANAYSWPGNYCDRIKVKWYPRGTVADCTHALLPDTDEAAGVGEIWRGVWAPSRDTEPEMRIVFPVFGGGDGGESRSLRGKMGRMRQLLWLRPNPCMEVHMHSEPGVWLRSFQLIDTDAQYEVSHRWRSEDVCVLLTETGAVCVLKPGYIS